jgi:hypothetical protein
MSAPNLQSNSEIVLAVLALGPEFQSYAFALQERGTVDSAFLQALGKAEQALLYMLIPKAHQTKLDELFCFGSCAKTSEDLTTDDGDAHGGVGIEHPNTDDDDSMKVHAALELQLLPS